MIDSQRGVTPLVGYNHFMSNNKREWKNYLSKTFPKYKLQKKTKSVPENHAYAYYICRAWYNRLSPLMDQPMKTLGLNYSMIQF